jgi:hypothetical protein
MNQLLRTYVLPALMPLLAGLGACPSSGCALWTPGASVQRGIGQSKLYEWRADGGFWVEGKGTQEEQFTMAQGILKMKEGENGEPTIDWENSVVEYYLTARPSAKVAGNAMEQAFQAGTAQAGIFAGAIGELVSAIVPLIPVPGATTTGATP